MLSPVNVSTSIPYGHTILDYLNDAYTAKGWSVTLNTNQNNTVNYHGSMSVSKQIVMADNTTRRFAFRISVQNSATSKAVGLWAFPAGVALVLTAFGLPVGSNFHSYSIADADLAGTWAYFELAGDSDAFIILNTSNGRIVSFWPPSGTMHDAVCTNTGGPEVGLLPLPVSTNKDMVYVEAQAGSRETCHPFGGTGSVVNATTDYTSSMPPSFYNFATVIATPTSSGFAPYFTDFSGNIGMFSNFTNGDVIGEGGINTLRVGTTYYIQLGLNNGILLNYGATNPGL